MGVISCETKSITRLKDRDCSVWIDRNLIDYQLREVYTYWSDANAAAKFRDRRRDPRRLRATPLINNHHITPLTIHQNQNQNHHCRWSLATVGARKHGNGIRCRKFVKYLMKCVFKIRNVFGISKLAINI